MLIELIQFLCCQPVQVAVLATLAILRVISVTSTEKIQVKCITFSQPPVGNAALREYVHHYICCSVAVGLYCHAF